jgi:hypothetical protein
MEPKGRGGWLGFLIFQLFAAPLVFAGIEAGDLSALERQGGSLPNGFFTVYIFSIILSGCPLFFAGHTLATGARRQDAIDALKYMWGGFATLIVIPVIVLDHYIPRAVQDSGVIVEIMKSVIRVVFWGCIWTIYIFKSKRVKNTFMPEGGWKNIEAERIGEQTSGKLSPDSAENDHVFDPKILAQNWSESQQLMPPSLDTSASMDNVELLSKSKSTQINEIGTVNISVEEKFWEKAIHEFEENRRPGLWAKCFSNAKGNEELAKAIYLEARVQELNKNYEVLLLKKAELKKSEEQAAKLEAEARQRLAYEKAPKGECSNCQNIQLLDAKKCKKCHAIFGDGSIFQIRPVEKV